MQAKGSASHYRPSQFQAVQPCIFPSHTHITPDFLPRRKKLADATEKKAAGNFRLVCQIGHVSASPLAPAEESAGSSLEQHADVEAKAWWHG